MARTSPSSKPRPEPEPARDGDRTQLAAIKPPATQPAITLDLFGTLVTFQVRSAETDGAYAILEMVLPPDDTGSGMHVQESAETFQILSGELEFQTTRDGFAVTFRAKAGDIVHMPPNTPHAFRNAARSASTCQVVLAPGSLEGYFLELGTPTAHLPPRDPSTRPDMERVRQVSRKYGIDLLEAK